MKIGIIGSGTMGISIGHFMSLKDNPTIIYDNSKKTLKQAEENLVSLITKLEIKNKYIRKNLKTLCQQENIKFYVPAPRLCVDNATMVAWSGIERFVNGDEGDSLSLRPKPRWNLEEL